MALAVPVFAGDIAVTNFVGGLNTQDNPAEIDPSAAQDLLNVNIQPGGAAVFKRDGYGLFQGLPINTSTTAVHGGYHFQQIGGNDVQLWGNDIELSGSVNDASFVKLATGTLNATWQCADSQGFAYCLTSSRDMAVKTDGSSANTTYQNAIPLGTMLTFTPLQLVVAGVSGNESTLYISQQNNFINFTVGVLPSSSFTEPIASPGSRITHIAYYFGKLFWWKDQSFGYATFTNQNDWQLTIVSNQVGTFDNSDAFWNSSGFDAGTKFSGTASANANKSPGGIFFRGQDNHLYVYDGFYLTRLSRVITPTVTAASKKKANSWTQNTQTAFQSGSITPSNTLSTTIAPASVITSSFTNVENSSTQWISGSVSNLTVNPSSITLNTNNSGNVTNPDFESAFTGNWTDSGSNVCTQKTTQNAANCTLNPQHGSNFAFCGDVNTPTFSFQIIDTNSNVLATSTPSRFNDCTYRQITLTDNTDLGKRVKFRIKDTSSACPSGCFLTTSDSYIFGGSISYFFADGNGDIYAAFDNIQNGSSTITSGSFTSKIFDTTVSSALAQVPSFSYIANTSTPSFTLFTSSNNNGPWASVTSTTSANNWGQRYYFYSSTISINSTDNALSAITGMSELFQSTGTYYSAVNNAPNLTSWGSLNVTDNLPGASAITYFTRSSTNSFTVLSSTPAWISQTKNSTIASSTGTFFQLRADYTITAATEAPNLSFFAFNWFEGTASDKAYITYFNDAIWFSVSNSSSASTNNRIFYWDILNGAWMIYDIPSNGFLVENNTLYFGDPVQGRVFKFGGVTTDNAASINSYWRSKSFLGQDPFVQNEFVQSDFILGESSTTLTYTYTLDSKSSTAFAMTAFDSAASLIQRNFLLPIGKIGKYYDFKIGDNSSNAKWVLMGHKVHYNPLNWKPVLN